jgi:hypothetical protein
MAKMGTVTTDKILKEEIRWDLHNYILYCIMIYRFALGLVLVCGLFQVNVNWKVPSQAPCVPGIYQYIPRILNINSG